MMKRGWYLVCRRWLEAMRSMDNALIVIGGKAEDKATSASKGVDAMVKLVGI